MGTSHIGIGSILVPFSVVSSLTMMMAVLEDALWLVFLSSFFQDWDDSSKLSLPACMVGGFLGGGGVNGLVSTGGFPLSPLFLRPTRMKPEMSSTRQHVTMQITRGLQGKAILSEGEAREEHVLWWWLLLRECHVGGSLGAGGGMHRAGGCCLLRSAAACDVCFCVCAGAFLGRGGWAEVGEESRYGGLGGHVANTDSAHVSQFVFPSYGLEGRDLCLVSKADGARRAF